MNRIAIALAVGVFAAGSALASDESDIMAVLKQFNDSDMTTSAASCANDAAAVDIFPPYDWHGPGACANTAKDFDAFAQKQGIADVIGTFDEPKQVNVAGDRAYVSLPATYRWTQNGNPVKVTGMMAFVLHKTVAGWRITTRSWATLTCSRQIPGLCSS